MVGSRNGAIQIYYTIYGLVVRSEVTLPEVTQVDVDSADPDVTIRVDDIETPPELDEESGPQRFSATPGRCTLVFESIGTFLIEDGTRIRCDPVSDEVVDSTGFRRIVKRQAMGILLHQRGDLVLHASAVNINDTAVVFFGTRGAGKSTTVAAFHARGYRVIADDVVAIRFANDTPVVAPGVPNLRLLPDAADRVGVAYPSATKPSTRKQYVRAEGVDSDLPLSTCYLLARGDREEATVEPLSNREAFFEFLRHSYAVSLLTDTESQATHFRLSTRVIDRVTCKQLQRPDNLDALSEIIALVCDDVGY